jgi:nucleotide-binding universal stress UspA family protein
MYKRILVATDGSYTSEHALTEVAKLAGDDSEVRVVTVLENPLTPFPAVYVYMTNSEQFLGKLVEEGEEILDRARETLADLGVRADTKLIQLPETNHDIPGALYAEAEAWSAEVIVLGTHGRKGIKRLFMGSVAEQLVRLSHLPVLLVHGPSED